jgi:MFS family permease
MSAAETAKGPGPSGGTSPSHEVDKPPRAGAILTVLILGAVVANINLAIANVALPSIGAALDTSQAELNLVAVGFTLGLASSVLYLGALADRYGRKSAMMAGAALSVPTSLLAAWAPNATVLIVARVSGGVAAGLLYPITLSLITGLFRGGARTRAIALWSGIGGGCSALGPLVGGLLLGRFWWGSVFLPSVPIAALVIVLAGPQARPLSRSTTSAGSCRWCSSVPWCWRSAWSPTTASTAPSLGCLWSPWSGWCCSCYANVGRPAPCSTSRCCAPGPSPSP